MIAVYLAPIYILVNLYVIRWLMRWMGACSHHFKKRWMQVIVVVIYTFFATSMAVGFFLPHGKAERTMKLIGNYWLGVTLYMLLTIVIADLLRILLKRWKRINQEKLRSRKTFVAAGTACILIIAGISIYGVLNAGIIRTTKYEVNVDKDGGKLDSLNVMLIADLHLGYNIGCRQMEQMVQKINVNNPDLVVIAGDIFDNEYDALEDPERLISILKGIESKYGVYACYGNHDVAEKILAGFTFSKKGVKKESDIRMDEFVEKAGIKLLRDEAVLIDDSFYLYGRPDAERPGRGVTLRNTPEEITANLDQTKPILVMDHEPRQLQEMADAGVDLDLCGHTHDGQVFPGNITINFFWENACGYLKKDQMHNIVTSGVGLYGPNMRVGTKAEICPITVHFTK